MPSVLLVDNYYAPGKILTLRNSLSSSGAKVTVVGRDEASPARFGGHDGVVLSGSPAMLSERGAEKPFQLEMEAIRDSSTPILGICFGHQLIGVTYGSKVVRAPKPTKRYVETDVLLEDEIFSGLPPKISVYESHHEIVESVPAGFSLVATSATSPVAAIRHRRLSIVGVQFHPEKNSGARPDGRVFVGNFVRSLG